MAKKICSLIILVLAVSGLSPECVAKDKTNKLKDNAERVQREQERNTVSLELEITKRAASALENVVSVLLGSDSNGYATGFLVGDGLVMTAYHVVSGELSDSKKINMGFSPKDQLEVKIYVKGCRATVLKVDKEADLALLEICSSGKQTNAPAFQSAPGKDEMLVLIARPHGTKMISKGPFRGAYTFRGQEYWSAKLASRDGYSGSPVYNHKAEVVGVFTGYDWVRELAVISPAIKAQKLLEDYSSSAKP